MDDGDVIKLPGGVFAQVSQLSPAPILGQVNDVHARLIAGDVIDLHPGSAQVLSTFDKLNDLSGCYASFSPLPGSLPATAVAPDAQVVLRFSEPMDPASLQPFDTFTVTRKATGVGITDFVVGQVLASDDLKEFRFVPSLPLSHTEDVSEAYFMNLVADKGGVTDLAGNTLVEFIDQVSFTLTPDAPTERNGGLVLRFENPNEDGDFSGTTPLVEYAGQFLVDPIKGLIRPRPVERFSASADQTNGVPSIMIDFPQGVQTPLSPLGSRMMSLYRHFDVGLSLTDNTTYNLDVEGLCWMPLQGQVQADFFEGFEINLAHSIRLPDEHRNAALLPTKISSGLAVTTYVANILEDPANGLVTMHEKGEGYLIDPVNLFIGGTGKKLLPYPINKNKPEEDWTFYTWRDTSIYSRGGFLGNGIPTLIENDAGLLANDPALFGSVPGSYASVGNVPTIGLPLLMEVKCYPSDNGIGLNALSCAIAINSSSKPTFRIFSTGGYDTAQNPVAKNPDTQPSPTGGFNATTTTNLPIGATTPKADPVFYYGQLDLVVRVSRTFTRWLNTQDNAPDYLAPVLEPRAEDQPTDTELNMAFRGAATFNNLPGAKTVLDDVTLNAAALNAYGDEVPNLGTKPYGSLAQQNPRVNFLSTDVWSSDINTLDTAQFLQVRFTFIGNTISGLTPELSAFGVAFLRNS